MRPNILRCDWLVGFGRSFGLIDRQMAYCGMMHDAQGNYFKSTARLLKIAAFYMELTLKKQYILFLRYHTFLRL